MKWYTSFRRDILMTFDKVKDLIHQELKVSLDKITLDSKLQEDLGADSLDAVELIMSMEDMFDISISDEQAQGLKTVKDLVDLIDNK